MNQKISKKQLRDFGYVIALGLPLIIGWLIPAITGHTFRGWTIWVSIPALIFGIFYPSILKRPYKAWIKLGEVLGWLNSRIILSIVFIFILQPISIFMKVHKSRIDAKVKIV